MTEFNDHHLIAEVLNSPVAPLLLKEIKSRLDEEKKKRKRFYNDITEQEKAEFINGEIIIHSPVMKMYNEVNGNLYSILKTYVVEHDLGFVGIEKILIQCTRNDYEPDLCFFGKAKAKKLKPDQALFPIPDMIVEVLSKSTEGRDRGIKFDDYESHGVREYWIIDPKKKVIEQYKNGRKGFELVLKSKSGEIASIVIDKLVIPIKAIFSNKLAHAHVKGILVEE